MNQGVFTVIGAGIAAATTLIALIISNILSERSKRRARRLEIAIGRCDEQVGKLYAPLANLIQQLETTEELKDKMVEQDPLHEADIQKFTYDNYFLPIHQKIGLILEHQLHLLEGETIPPSFIEYYKHVASERMFFSLKEKMTEAKNSKQLAEEAADVTFHPTPFPKPDFKRNVADGFARALSRQEEILRLLDKDAPDARARFTNRGPLLKDVA